jgi:hypothetical protein
VKRVSTTGAASEGRFLSLTSVAERLRIAFDVFLIRDSLRGVALRREELQVLSFRRLRPPRLGEDDGSFPTGGESPSSTLSANSRGADPPDVPSSDPKEGILL